MNSDLISRQAAIDAVKKNTFRLTFAEEQNCEGHVAWSANAIYSDVIEGALLELPSAQSEPHYDEWCTDCKEYDHARHCCPRWNRVIRETLKDAQPNTDHIYAELSKVYNVKGLPDEAIGIIGDLMLSLDEPSVQPKSEERTAESAQNVPKEDLISRKAAIDVIRSYYDEQYASCDSIEELIEKLSSAQPERKTGRWIAEPNCWYRCSNCGAHYPSIHRYMDYKFCPKCGADMRGE